MPSSDPLHEEYDLIVLGSGEAGKYIAWTEARKGQRVVVIEHKYIGGSCPNIACLPSKNVIHSAKVASYFFRGAEFGISKENTRIDMTLVRDRKRFMVHDLVEMHVGIYQSSGAELLIGSGRFVGPNTVEVTLADRRIHILRGKKVVISTGSRATLDSVDGLSEAAPMTHIEALELDQIPSRLLILGGGYIGLELAQAMRRFGCEVTIIDRNTSLLHREDDDVTAAIHKMCQEEGIDVITGAVAYRVEGRSGDWVKLFVHQDGTELLLEGTHLLVASGRTPNTEGLGLEFAGIEKTERGFVKVNERLETTAPDVFAVGDCAGSPHFTHIAYDDFRILRDNWSGGHRVTTGRQVPFCVFIDPELARIGLSEKEAQAQGIAYRLAKIPMKSVLRTRTLSETRGFMKALIATDSERILGVTILGVSAGETIAPVQVALLAGLPYTALRDMIFTHPTMCEGLVNLFSAVPPRAVS